MVEHSVRIECRPIHRHSIVRRSVDGDVDAERRVSDGRRRGRSGGSGRVDGGPFAPCRRCAVRRTRLIADLDYGAVDVRRTAGAVVRVVACRRRLKTNQQCRRVTP